MNETISRVSRKAGYRLWYEKAEEKALIPFRGEFILLWNLIPEDCDQTIIHLFQK